VLSQAGALPGGLAFSNNGDGTATVEGTPEAGTGGDYPITMVAANGAAPDAAQTLTLRVQGTPTVAIAAPADGATFTAGQTVATDFACTEGPGGPGIAACADQDGHPSGAPLDTSVPGRHAVTVTAQSKDGLTSTATVAYAVVAGSPIAMITSPQTCTVSPTSSMAAESCHLRYRQGQTILTRFSCTEGPGGPGLASCDDSAGTSTDRGGVGQLDTSAAGAHSYIVTATSRGGRTGTRAIRYRVVARPHLVSILSSRSVVSAGRAPIRVRCTGGTPGSACRGTLTVRLGETVLARARYTVARGRTERLAIRLTASARRLLRHAIGHRLRATMIAAPSSGTSTRATIVIRLSR